MKEFLGMGGYQRVPEGFLSWQHLLFIGILLGSMLVLSIYLGKRNRALTDKQKNRPLIYAAFLIDGIEVLKIIGFCVRDLSFQPILHCLPLFLCSIQLIAIPLAAFSKGHIREAALDFVGIFGILGAIFGNIGAAQNYGAYPVMSLDNVASGLTHTISGFASLYVLITGLAQMKKKNIGITFGILFGFCIAAYIANVTIPYNYMFLMAGDGTPYDIVYNFVNGSKVLYPLGVVLLFVIYIVLFYWLFHVFARRKDQAKSLETANR